MKPFAWCAAYVDLNLIPAANGRNPRNDEQRRPCSEESKRLSQELAAEVAPVGSERDRDADEREVIASPPPTRIVSVSVVDRASPSDPNRSGVRVKSRRAM